MIYKITISMDQYLEDYRLCMIAGNGHISDACLDVLIQQKKLFGIYSICWHDDTNVLGNIDVSFETEEDMTLFLMG